MGGNISGYVIDKVGKVGAGNGGTMVHFELKDPQGGSMTFVAPQGKMNEILFALSTAMQLATDELAKNPGYNPAEGSFRMGVRTFGTAIGHAPGEPTVVALHLQTEVGATLDLMLPIEQARKIGSDLIQAADKAGSAPPQRPS